MKKKQHIKDRMFITKTEWATEWGDAKSKKNCTPFKRLFFHCCTYASLFIPTFVYIFIKFMLIYLQQFIFFFWVFLSSLTFTPFGLPKCTKDGSVFNLMNIILYITKHRKNLVTRDPLKQYNLISLTFHKNSEDVVPSWNRVGVLVLSRDERPMTTCTFIVTWLLHLLKLGVSKATAAITSFMSDGGGHNLVIGFVKLHNVKTVYDTDNANQLR
ncbi:hypothetical protein REPUB_Repub14bG0079300 [Reevesia pubescens]